MLTVKNLGRNKRRTVLTVLAIALPLFVFLTTATLKRQIEEVFEDMKKSMRVAVHQKLTFTSQLPQRIRGEIESMAPEGFVEGVCRTTWFGGKIEGTQMAFPSMGVDHDTFHVVYDNFGMTDEDVASFSEERRGAVVGKQFAQMTNLGVGDKVTLKGTIPPFPEMEFLIVAIPEGIVGPWLYFRLDYYDEVYRKATNQPVGVHNFWLRCANDSARKWALEEIDRHYENSPHETRTETESTFIRAFLESGGDWVGLAWSVGCMVVFVALSVGFNTMSMSFRERVQEIAVLRALGFSAMRIVYLVLLEGLILGLTGGLVAVMPLFLVTNLMEVGYPGFGRFLVDPRIAGLALAVAVVCGLLAAIFPAISAGRLEVARALRKVVQPGMSLPIRYNVLSMFSRPVGALSSVFLIAVVIAVFSYLQAVTDSAFSVMARTGDPLTVIVLNQSAESETVSGLGKDRVNKLQLAPNAVRDESGPTISAELVAISSAATRADPDVKVNAAVRGVEFDLANKVRQGRVRIVEGRMFKPGTYEAIVGESAAAAYAKHGVGDRIEVGNRGIREFEIVGVFSTGGTSADSEIRGYVETPRRYGRSGYSSARLRAGSASDALEMINYIEGPAVELTAMTEREYYSGLGRGQQATQVFSIAMIIVMGIASAFAVANTMYAAVAGRSREIGMLRAIGFSPMSVMTSFVLEGLLLSFAGGLVGCLFSLATNGIRQSILPEAFTAVSYTLRITPKIAGVSLAVALVIGFVGSVLPARRAARMPVTLALREG